MNGIKVEAEFKKLEFPANRRALRDIVRPRTSEIGTEKPYDITTDDEVIVPANALERIKNIGENDLLFIAICSPRFQKKTIMRAQLVPLSRLSGARFPNRKALDRQIFICRLRRLKVSNYLFSPFRCLPGNTSS